MGAELGNNAGQLSGLAYHPTPHTQAGHLPPESGGPGSTGLAVGMITLNLGVVWVLHQNGWVQSFEYYLRGRSKPEPLASPQGPTPLPLGLTSPSVEGSMSE